MKKNCKRKPPYDWSDIAEKSKDEAMARIAESGDAHTNYYWNLAVPTEDCPNWIARWFLYHKFRYRDGRNRNPARSEEKHSSHGSSSKHPHHKHSGVVDEDHGYCDSQTTYYPSVSTTTGTCSRQFFLAMISYPTIHPILMWRQYKSNSPPLSRVVAEFRFCRLQDATIQPRSDY